MRRLLTLVIIAFYGCGFHAAGENITPKRRDAKEVGLYRYLLGRGLFKAFEEGAEVYLCRVKDYVSISKEKHPEELERVSDETGRVTLEVVKKIRGQQDNPFLVPFVFRSHKSRMFDYDGRDLWPDAEELKGKLLLCVIVPTAYDPVVGNDPAFYGAVIIVVEVKDEKDAKVSEIKAICDLHDIKDAGKRKEAILKAVADERFWIQQYAKDAVKVLGLDEKKKK